MKVAMLMIVVGCGPTVTGPPVANTKTGPRAAPCIADRTKADGLACAVFLALQTGNEQGYAELMLHEEKDYNQLGKIMSHAPDQPFTDEERKKTLARGREDLRKMVAKLREREVDPSTMELVDTKSDEAVIRNDVGVAEDLTIVVRNNGVTIPVTIDDVVYLNGRWMILDGLKLRD